MRVGLKEISVSEYQKVEINLLKVFHDFCEKNGLTYFLYYGTLIGALRHKGPIPWDDDIDVVMPRPDYDRLMKIFVDSDSYCLFAVERGNSMFRFARLCDIEKTHVITNLKFVRGQCSPGVWIDICALDGATGDPEIDKAREQRVTTLKGRINYCRLPISWICEAKTFGGKIHRVVNYLYSFLFWRLLIKRLDTFAREVDYSMSSFCSSLINLGYPGRETMPKEWFKGRRLVDFGSIKAYVPSGAEKILATMYGDWRTPTPIEERNQFSHYVYVEKR